MLEKYILLIDDHAMFRSGLRMLINTAFPDIKVIDDNSLDEALKRTVGIVDLIFLDVNLAGNSGIDGIALLKQKWPQADILMLSAQDDSNTLRRALILGAAGFISKTEAAESVISTIKLVLSGEFSAQAPAVHNGLNQQLTPRQHEVLALLQEGLSNKLIADKLLLSNNTVRRHVQDILTHFGAASRAEAVYLSRGKTPKI